MWPAGAAARILRKMKIQRFFYKTEPAGTGPLEEDDHGAAKAVMVTQILLFFLLGIAGAVEKPWPMLLHSAYTPFTEEGQLDVSQVGQLAVQAKGMGVNTVFVGGSMAEFDTLTINERKTLMQAWLEAAQTNGLYTIVNVGTTVLVDAQELAATAQRFGADAIATVPPYYTRAGDVETLVEWLADVASAAPTLPFWFYHLPGVTHVEIDVADLLSTADASGKLPQLLENGGVKFVSSDLGDFLTSSNWVASSSYNTSILFAPEPKLQGFALQTPYQGAVLAEDFYAPTYLRMRALYEEGDADGAIAEQNWKQDVAEPIFSKYGGTAAKRVSYRKSCGVEMGCNRAPGTCFNESNYEALVAELDAIGFWDQAPPPATAFQ